MFYKTFCQAQNNHSIPVMIQNFICYYLSNLYKEKVIFSPYQRSVWAVWLVCNTLKQLEVGQPGYQLESLGKLQKPLKAGTHSLRFFINWYEVRFTHGILYNFFKIIKKIPKGIFIIHFRERGKEREREKNTDVRKKQPSGASPNSVSTWTRIKLAT